jgi:hypothetical protein
LPKDNKKISQLIIKRGSRAVSRIQDAIEETYVVELTEYRSIFVEWWSENGFLGPLPNSTPPGSTFFQDSAPPVQGKKCTHPRNVRASWRLG